MRLGFERTVVTILLATCLVCPLVEMFDHWDRTIQTGNDSEYALVALSLCVGAAYSFARLIVKCSEARRSAKFGFAPSVQISFQSAKFSFDSLFNAISPPPLELRT
jgi:hypothetical protein